MVELCIHNIRFCVMYHSNSNGFNLEFISIICISKTYVRKKYFDTREICKKKPPPPSPTPFPKRHFICIEFIHRQWSYRDFTRVQNKTWLICQTDFLLQFLGKCSKLAIIFGFNESKSESNEFSVVYLTP